MHHNIKKTRKILLIMLTIMCLIIASILSVSQHIKTLEKDNILGRYTEGSTVASNALYESARDFKAEAIIVPGAAILSDKTPSPVLKARLDVAIDLYNNKVAKKILLTGDGDNSQDYYDEISSMLSYVKERGVADEDVFCDHKGYSTFESMVRAKQIFGIDRAIVVSQSFHLPRAVYIGQKMDMKTRGIASDQVGSNDISWGNFKNEKIKITLREIMARNKDFFILKFKAIPEFKDERINIDGDGRITHTIEKNNK